MVTFREMSDNSRGPADPIDIIGIGALNVDYISHAVSNSYVRRILDGGNLYIQNVPVSFEWGSESAVDERTVYSVLELVEPATLTAAVGGSAFNAIYALAQMRLNLTLGYVGVAGKPPLQGLSSVEELRKHKVDTDAIHYAADTISGVCISLMDGGERTLLTHAGANAVMGSVIADNFTKLLQYLRRARVVHVTSFLDAVTPRRLLELLEALRESKPDVLITFDPGHVWCTERTPEVLGMIALTDYLLLNSMEFTALGQATAEESDTDTAARVLTLMQNQRGVTLVKRATGIATFRRDGHGVAAETFTQHPLREDEIEDSTGAGDVFAAGLLAVLASSRLQLELGALLGMRLARHKLRYVGSQGFAEFADLTRSFIAARNAERLGSQRPDGIFVAHGGDPQWLAIKDYLEREFSVPVYSFESGVWGSTQVTTVLNEYLSVCSLAICVLTVEDLIRHGRGLARQNVVHEVGLFQGRYGSERVIVLVEEGCEFLPDIGSTQPLVFTRNSVRQIFWSLKEELLRKGVAVR